MNSLPPPQDSYYEQTEISIEMHSHLVHYRKIMSTWHYSPDTLQQTLMIDSVKGLKNFLLRAKETIFMQCEENGWPTYRGQGDPIGSGYVGVYESLMQSIDNFIEEPNMGSSYMINEQFTQLLWLVVHEKEHIQQ